MGPNLHADVALFRTYGAAQDHRHRRYQRVPRRPEREHRLSRSAPTFAQIPWTVVEALLLGGVMAATNWPRRIVRILPARILGTAVGGVILITNMKTFLGAVGISGLLTNSDLCRDRGRLDRRPRILDPGQPSGGGNRRRR